MTGLSVGFVSPGWPARAFPNGVVRYVSTVAPEIESLGHRVSILALHGGPRTPLPGVYWLDDAWERRSMPRRVADAIASRVSLRAAQRAASRRYIGRTASRMAREREVQLIEMEEAFGWPRMVRGYVSARICVRLHGPWFLVGRAGGVPEDAGFRDRVEAEGKALAVADAVTAPTFDVLRRVREFYGLPLRGAEVIPNPTPFVPADARWNLAEADRRRVLFVGRFDTIKGGDLAIDAFAEVLRRVPDARLTLVGPDHGCAIDGGPALSLPEYARARIPGGLESGAIQWLGPQPFEALASLRRAAMVTIVPSRYESFGGTVLEAIAAGCPLVAAAVGGIPEIVQDGVNGELHRPGDASDLANRVVALMNSPERAAALGAHGAAGCEERFHPRIIAEQTVAFYRKVLGA